MQALEARLGARLLNRTTRRVSLTAAGEEFYARASRLLVELDEAENLFSPGAAPAGRLKVSLPGRMARAVIAPALAEYRARYPAVVVEFSVTDRPVDLVREGFDLAVRAGALPESGLIAAKLGDMALVNCASPAYLAERGAPKTPADLDRHLMVGYASPASGRLEGWEYLEGGQYKEKEMPVSATVNDAETYIALALAGFGLIQIPAYDAQEALTAGALVRVLEKHPPAPMPLSFVYPHRAGVTRPARAFMDWAGALLRKKALAAA